MEDSSSSNIVTDKNSVENTVNDNINCSNDDKNKILELNNYEKQEKSNNIPTSTGYYDADKCRAYIANQIKVNKIDRLASQISKASEIESSNELRLERLINMFTKCSSKVMHDFTMRCKLGVQSHRQDRILNHKRKKGPSSKMDNKHNKRNYKTMKIYNSHNNNMSKQREYYYPSISNDLLYGPGAQLVHTLLSSESIALNNNNNNNFIKRKHSSLASSDNDDIIIGDSNIVLEENNETEKNKTAVLTDDDYLLSDYFEPELFVKKMEDLLRVNVSKSQTINKRLCRISQIFEKLALKHRDKVDKVYSIEEERQATSVTRRSAYNLSVAAIKATSTPVHINTNDL